jgi:geranylgeranyl diphosphate synthase type II
VSGVGSRESFLAGCRERVDRCLDKILPPAAEPPVTLHQAMRYAVFSGGKRLRPALAFAAAEAVGGEPDRVMPVAAAVELVHAYSLVHDDLPAMDDDQERRGRPTVHVRYGEATAILVGDALLAEAFAGLAGQGAPPDVLARLARAAGSRALVGGQADDLAFGAGRPELDAILSVHARKTAELFRFAVWGAARLLGSAPSVLDLLERFGRHYGMAFQLLDDLLDADPTECSILRVLSADEARVRMQQEVSAAVAALEPLGEAAGTLRGLAGSLLERLT